LLLSVSLRLRHRRGQARRPHLGREDERLSLARSLAATINPNLIWLNVDGKRPARRNVPFSPISGMTVHCGCKRAGTIEISFALTAE
jgi:hypothetical protein